eukprot:6213596-Pleurochrysis_carterae.AAC.4
MERSCMACESRGLTSRGHFERALASAACCAAVRGSYFSASQPGKKFRALVILEVAWEAVDFACGVDRESLDALHVCDFAARPVEYDRTRERALSVSGGKAGGTSEAARRRRAIARACARVWCAIENEIKNNTTQWRTVQEYKMRR